MKGKGLESYWMMWLTVGKTVLRGWCEMVKWSGKDGVVTEEELP